ncbi:sorting nexin-32 isoform X2 [Contarinia nasturtii]|uniref:sorting nexin-32 isoform X2 n=1 Tax=Contarinia nasturtii TaxID=265458 RepID=UPI0012D4C02D|nr:sorting nexin-32 isoform X2 [Contarinia nasturtii]
MYTQFGSAVKKVFSSDDNLENNNILETTHHSKPIFEKINPDKYFRITDSADETTTNGNPLHDENGDNGDSVTSVSDAGSGTPPLQLSSSQIKQQGSIDEENNGTNAAAIATTTPTNSIPLAENTLLVDISDALSEKDKVKFTVHTRTTFPTYAKKDFLVVRQHEEFIWLHDRYEENEEYAGYIIPPCPPRPDFDASREKLQRLGEGEGNMTKEEFKKMKQELEAEYLATFKKTVAMHEVFLSRLAAHPVFRMDQHLKVFLEYDQDLCAKPRKKIDLFGGLVRSLGKTTDEIYLGATVRDVNDFFENEYTYLTELNAHLKEGATRTERMTKKHKEVADTHIKISSNLVQLSTHHSNNMEKFLAKSAEVFEKIRNMEGRVSSDQDLKLGDTLRYYQRDSNAAKALLVRRLRCLAAYETANRNLEKARSKNKDVHAAEQAQTDACEKFEAMSARGKQELISFRTRRVAAFKKSLIELAELEVKHAKSQYEYLRQSVLALRELA